MNLKPLDDRIVVRPAEPETQTASGLVIPDTAKEKPQEAEVVAASPGKLVADGKRALFDGNRLLDHSAENHRMTLGEGLFEGTGGTLSLTGDGGLHLRQFGQTESPTALPPMERPGFGGDCVYALQRHVLNGLNEGQPFENEAAEYLFVREVEDAIYRSAQMHTRVEV